MNFAALMFLLMAASSFAKSEFFSFLLLGAIAYVFWDHEKDP